MHRFFSRYAVVALLILAACDSDPTAPRPAALAPLLGDEQTALVGTTLPQPLQVAVRDSRERPLPDTWVHWHVAPGRGSLTADSVRTDAQGTASVQLVLGDLPGELRVTASVAGLAPVQFTVTALSHCQANVPRTLRLLGGNEQSALTHDSLAAPLQVQALCDDETPLPDVSVAWQVASGTATLYGSTFQTDAAGVASTSLSLGANPGSVVVRATAPGVAPVELRATALDRCAPRATLEPGQTIETTIKRVDCDTDPGIYGGSRYTVYRLDVAEPQFVRLRMQILANGVDPMLQLWDEQGTRLLGSGPGEMYVRLDPGTYRLRTATSPASGGTRIAVSRVTVDAVVCSDVFPNAPTPVWLLRPATVSGAITRDDCGRSLDAPRWYDQYLVQLSAGESITATLSPGTGFAPTLTFGTVDRHGFGQSWTLIGFYPSTGEPVTATLTAPRAGIYAIHVDGGGNDRTGTYSLEVR